MKILLIDGYKKTDFLIKRLLCKEHDITLLHEDIEFCEKMLNKFDSLEVYNGDATKKKIIENLEEKKYDIAIVLSNLDSKNFVMAKTIKEILQIGKVISLVSNPNNKYTFQELGIETPISASHLITKIIQKLALFNESSSYISIGEYDVRPIEVKINNTYKSVGKKIEEIKFPDGCVVCAILRNKESIIPNGKTVILENDNVVLFTNLIRINEIEDALR